MYMFSKHCLRILQLSKYPKNLLNFKSMSESVARSDHVFETNSQVFRKNITDEELVSFYRQWASHYDEDTGSAERYKGPPRTAMEVSDLYPHDKERKLVKILDVAAGTGHVAVLFRKLQFSGQIDGVDPVQELLDIAKEKKCYNNLFCEKFDETSAKTKRKLYDVVTVSGGMGDGHIPTSSIVAMTNVVKPGGFIVIVMREEYLRTVEEYRRNFEPTIYDLAEKNVIKIRKREVFEEYFCGKEGLVYVLEVLK